MAFGIISSAKVFYGALVAGSTTFTVDTVDDGFAQTLSSFFLKAANSTSLEFIYLFPSLGSTFKIPSVAQVGDLCVVVQYSYNDVSEDFPTKVIPTGFTEISDAPFDAGNEFRVVSMYKAIASGDINTTVTGMDGEGDTKFVFIFRPETTATYSFGSVNTAGDQGDISAQTVTLPSNTVSSDQNPIIVFGIKSTRDDSVEEAASLTGSDTFTNTIHKRSETSTDSSRVGFYLSQNGKVNAPISTLGKTTFNVNTVDDGAVQNFGAFFVKAENGGTLSEVQFTQASSISTFNISSDAQAGDICIAVDYHHTITSSATRPTKVIPTGFTEILDNSTDGTSFDSTLTISYKVLDSNDAGTNKDGYGGTTGGRANKTTLIIRPSSTATVTVGDVYSENGFFTNGTNNVVNLPSDSDATDTNPVIVVGVKCARNDGSQDDVATLDGDSFTATKIHEASDPNHMHRVSYYLANTGKVLDTREDTSGNYTFGWGDLVYSSSSSSVSVPYPNDITAGDLLGVRFWTGGNTLTSTQITTLQNDGWDTSFNNTYRIEIYKIATGSESGSLSLTLTNNENFAGFMFRMRHDSKKEIEVRGADGGYSSGAFTFQNESAYNNGNDACVACFGINSALSSMAITEQSSGQAFVDLTGLYRTGNPSFYAVWSSDFADSATMTASEGVNQRVRYYGIPT